VTDESPELVQEWLARAKPSYPIAITNGEFESLIKVPHFPYCAVIGPDGRLAYAGNSGAEESSLDEALGRSSKTPLWPKSLGKVLKIMREDDAKAYAELRKLSDGGKVSAEDRPYVDGFLAYFEGRAASALEQGKKLLVEGWVREALQEVAPYRDTKTPYPCSADLAQLVKDLEAVPEFKRELSGGELYAEARSLEKSREYTEAVETYCSVYKKYSGTRIAEHARKRAEQLVDDGMPGYSTVCNPCRKAGRACDKHRETVKL